MPCVDHTAELKRAVDEVPSMHFPLTPFQHMADVLETTPGVHWRAAVVKCKTAF